MLADGGDCLADLGAVCDQAAQGRLRRRVPRAAGLVQICFSVGYDLTEGVREAIQAIADQDCVCSFGQDGSERLNGQVCEITEHLNLKSWPTVSRVIVRRERAHPARS